MPAPLTPDQRRDVLRLLTEGYTHAAIARQLLIHRHTVGEVAHDAGLERVAKKSPLAALPADTVELLAAFAATLATIKCQSCGATVTGSKTVATSSWRCLACRALACGPPMTSEVRRQVRRATPSTPLSWAEPRQIPADSWSVARERTAAEPVSTFQTEMAKLQAILDRPVPRWP